MADEATQQPSAEATELFTRLFAANQRRIYGLIRSLVINPADVEEIFQESVTVLWRKFGTFEPGTDFVAWSLKVARLQVMAFRKKAPRAGSLVFSAALLDQLADEVESLQPEVQPRKEALRRCMAKLSADDRQLIDLRYESEVSPQKLAEQVGVSVATVYRTLGRIHDRLLACIRRSIAEGMA
jgi:RNA polymerase sigma-70 factor (ECF subfamily)